MNAGLDVNTIISWEFVAIFVLFCYNIIIFIISSVWKFLFPIEYMDFSRKYNVFNKRKSIRLLVFLLFANLSLIGLLSTFENYTLVNVQEEDLSVRIEKVSKELLKSSQTLQDIQTELENRISTVEELKNEAEIAENMISLTEEQVAAIQSKLNQELEASSGKSLLYSIIISTVFFLLGSIAHPIWNFFRKKTKSTAQLDISTKEKYTDEEIKQAIRLLEMIEKDK